MRYDLGVAGRFYRYRIAPGPTPPQKANASEINSVLNCIYVSLTIPKDFDGGKAPTVTISSDNDLCLLLLVAERPALIGRLSTASL